MQEINWLRVSTMKATLLSGLVVTVLSVSALESSVKDGTLTITVGKTLLSCTPASGNVSITTDGVRVKGNGILAAVAIRGSVPQIRNLGPLIRTGEAPALAADEALVVALQTGSSPGTHLIGLVNPGSGTAVMSVPLAVLGLSGETVYAVFDGQANRFSGPVKSSLVRSVPSGALSIVTLGETVQPTVLSTSRSLNGMSDLRDVKWDAGAKAISGTSSVEAGKTYELRLFIPPAPERLTVANATVTANTAEAGVTIDTMQTRQWLRVFLDSKEDREVGWVLTFQSTPPRRVTAVKVELSAIPVSPRCVRVTCYGSGSDLMILRSDGASFPVTNGTFEDRTVIPGSRITYSVTPVSWTGEATPLAKTEVTVPDLPPLPPLPNEYLSDIRPLRATNGWNGDPRRDLSIEDNPINIAGEVFKRGMGVHAQSELVYKNRPHYTHFVAAIGVDNEKAGQGTVAFSVMADGKELYKSPIMKGSDERVVIHVEIPEKAKEIRLIAGDAGDNNACDHADWANAGFLTNGPAPPEVFEPLSGFTSLFNGKNLSGWTGDTKAWSVNNGVLTTQSTKPVSLTWTGGEPENFQLKLRYRTDSPQSSIFFRSPAVEIKLPQGVKDGKNWNEVTLTARGSHIAHEGMNGAIIEEIVGDIKDVAPGFLVIRSTGKIDLKDIQVRTLATKYGASAKLFNGKDLTGWTHSSDALKKTWSVKDGVIVNDGKPAGYIRTVKDYTNYVLRVTMRHVTKGNSGVLLRMVGPDKVWPRSLEAQGLFNNMGDIWNIDAFPLKTDEKRLKGRRTMKMHGSTENSLGEWNLYEITLDGGNLEIHVNGTLQNSGTECWETPGKICLQSEGAKLEFKDILLIPIIREIMPQ